MASARARSRGGKAQRLGLREFARKLKPKASLAAVQKAIKVGRLRESIGQDGRGYFIADQAVAVREWTENAARPPNPGGVTKGGGLSPTGSLAEAQRRLVAQREIALELTNQQRQGRLVDAKEAERRYFEEGRTIREAMLAIPDRFASQLAAETSRAKVHEMLEAAILSTLTALADSLEDNRGQ